MSRVSLAGIVFSKSPVFPPYFPSLGSFSNEQLCAYRTYRLSTPCVSLLFTFLRSSCHSIKIILSLSVRTLVLSFSRGREGGRDGRERERERQGGRETRTGQYSAVSASQPGKGVATSRERVCGHKIHGGDCGKILMPPTVPVPVVLIQRRIKQPETLLDFLLSRSKSVSPCTQKRYH